MRSLARVVHFPALRRQVFVNDDLQVRPGAMFLRGRSSNQRVDADFGALTLGGREY
jgi:hypothetical protein